MRAMKDSGVEWIGEIPEQWDQMPLVRWLISRDGGAWGDLENGDSNDVVCLRIADFDYPKLTIKKTDDYTVRNYTTSIIERLQLEYGDILIEKSGGGEKTPVGRAIMYTADFRAMFANFMDRLRVTKELSSRYFLYIWTVLYLCGHVNPFIKQTTGIQNLDIRTMLATTMAPLPSLLDQSCIATFLDTKCAQIDAIIEKQQQVIEKLKAYKQSVITEAVTKGLDPTVPMKDSGVEWIGMVPEHWEIVRLKFLLTDLVDCPHETPNYNAEGQYYVIRTADQEAGLLRSDENMYRLPEEEYLNRIRRLSLDQNDIVYGREGERWGLACLVPESNKYCLGQRMMQFRCDNSVLASFYAVWVLNSKSTYQQGILDTFGSTSPHVNISTIRNYSISLPPLPEQHRIAMFLDELNTNIEKIIYEKAALMDKLTNYKKSLIYEAVTGKMEV